jgi:transcriptional regulator with XRE-family HTH domain
MLGERIRQARHDADMSQEKLSNLTGLHQFHISRIENGVIKDVMGSTIVRLSNALHVSPGYLLGVEDKPLHARR